MTMNENEHDSDNGGQNSYPTDWPERVDVMPPVPMTEEILLSMAEGDRIVRVWVPDERPESVATRGGTHEGDILTFWIESDIGFSKFAYESTGESGLAWYGYEPCMKGEESGEVAKTAIESDYRPIRGDEIMTTTETEHDSDDVGHRNKKDGQEGVQERFDIRAQEFHTCVWCGGEMGDVMFGKMDVPVGYIEPSLIHNQHPEADELVRAPLCDECHHESIEMAKNGETPVKEFDLENCEPMIDAVRIHPVIDAVHVLKNQDQPWAVEGKIDNARRTIVTAIAYGDVDL